MTGFAHETVLLQEVVQLLQPRPGMLILDGTLGGGGHAAAAGRSFMVRTKKYKYMVFRTAPEAEMFFDMEADPGEMKNLAGDAASAAEVGRHRRLLADWCKLTEIEKYPVQPSPKAERAAERPGRKKGQ